MRQYKFNKPIIESSLPPQSTDTMWIDIDESSGNILCLKEFRDNKWQSAIVQNSLPTNWTIVEIPENTQEYIQTIDVYSPNDSDTVVYQSYIPSEALLSTIPSGNEITIFYLEEKESALEKSKFIWICSKEGRKADDNKFITIDYIKTTYHKNNGDPVTGFDCVRENDVLEYYRSNPSKPFKWVSFKVDGPSMPY